MSETEMSPEERELRAALTRSVHALRATLKRMPVIDVMVDASDLTRAAEVWDEANASLREAEGFAEELGVLDDASAEAAMLAVTSVQSLSTIRHSLTMLCAMLDSRRVA